MPNFRMLPILLVTGVLFITSASAQNAFPHVDNLRSKTSLNVQKRASEDLIVRVVGERSSEFVIKVNSSLGPKDRDTFVLSQDGDFIQIEGTSGVAVSMGFYYYLKYFCYAQKTWAGEQIHLPSMLPRVTTPVVITRNDSFFGCPVYCTSTNTFVIWDFSATSYGTAANFVKYLNNFIIKKCRFFYYANVCTMSYSMAFWSWERWQQEIDWMAMRGINMPLAFIGQEAIFQRVYLDLGFAQKDLDEHFAGPAFLAWGRMGNIRKWGGPLPQMWITMKLVLQHKLLRRMRALGMIPVLPAFAGHVPSSITRVFPKANVTRLGLWSKFNSTYSATYLLDFQDPLFSKIGSAFIKALTNEFGTDHIYNADTFNEMEPSSSAPAYLAAAGKSVFDGMLAGDPEAVWLMQGWLFGNDKFWGPSQIKALVTSVPKGRMVILDLAAELNPIYNKTESFYGQPFIWCMLHNFGGTMELYGTIDIVSKGPFIGRTFPNSTMIGIGLTPEGIDQNEVMYEYMSEHAWRTQPWDLTKWVSNYTIQRYGASSPSVIQGWNLLMTSVYNAPATVRDHDKVMITKRPDTRMIQDSWWYDVDKLFNAWDSFINASHLLESSRLFQYDIVDVTRDCLQNVAYGFYQSIMNAYNAKEIAPMRVAGQQLSDLLTDLDSLLLTNDRFLTGTWIAAAKDWGTSADETKLYEMNARNQITLWGPNGEIHDYASKQWSGVVKDFYRPRWDFFVDWLQQLIHNGTRFDSYIFNEHILAAVESPWTLANYSYPLEPSGNAIKVATLLHSKYRKNGPNSLRFRGENRV